MKGGKRKGAGRPKGKPTVTLSFRVKEVGSKDLKTLIKSVIDKFQNED